jgi:hypothetical protein
MDALCDVNKLPQCSCFVLVTACVWCLANPLAVGHRLQ